MTTDRTNMYVVITQPVNPHSLSERIWEDLAEPTVISGANYNHIMRRALKYRIKFSSS